MIKNLDFVVLKPLPDIFKAEKFNFEFSSVSYYYFLQLKTLNIQKCSYIKIEIINEKKEHSITYNLIDRILYIYGSFDFTYYLQLTDSQKQRFQCEMMFEILKNTFNKFNIDLKILEEINNELVNKNWKLEYIWWNKKINNNCLFRLLIHMDINAFIFISEIIEGSYQSEMLVFKSIPTYFTIEFLFKTYTVINNSIRIGSKDNPAFAIDLKSKTVKVINSNERIRKFKYIETSSNKC